MGLYLCIVELLRKLQLEYSELEHEASHSCEDSRVFRENAGFSCVGSKNIVFHAKGKFYLVTTTAEKAIKARDFKKEFGTKDIRFATQEEITAVIGAEIGSIPPFGFENTIPIFVDKDVLDAQLFAFNPGIPTKSLFVSGEDMKNIYTSLKNPVSVFVKTEEVFEILGNYLSAI